MRKFKKALLLIWTCLTTFSCVLILDSDDRLEFSINELLDYNQGDIISYTNGIDTLNFTVMEAIIRENDIPYATPSIRMRFKTNLQSGYLISEGNYYNDYADYNANYLSITIGEQDTGYNKNLQISLEDKSNHTLGNCLVDYYENYDYRGKTYADVFEILYDTIRYSYNRPKVTFAVRAIPGGILKFYDSETDEMWELIDQ